MNFNELLKATQTASIANTGKLKLIKGDNGKTEMEVNLLPASSTVWNHVKNIKLLNSKKSPLEQLRQVKQLTALETKFRAFSTESINTTIFNKNGELVMDGDNVQYDGEKVKINYNSVLESNVLLVSEDVFKKHCKLKEGVLSYEGCIIKGTKHYLGGHFADQGVLGRYMYVTAMNFPTLVPVMNDVTEEQLLAEMKKYQPSVV